MNKYLNPIQTNLLANKLKQLITKLENNVGPQGTADYQTYDSVSAQIYGIIGKLYKDISAPVFENKKQVLAETNPDADHYNNIFSDIEIDLKILFTEFENLESVVLGNFNYMVSRINRLNAKLKKTVSRLGDYKLFSSTDNALFTSDTFNNLERIDFKSSLLKYDQGEIHEEEGIVTLPINTSSSIILKPTETPSINSNSNGVVGNNYEAGAVSYTDITNILDNNADTWFEYERVLVKDDGVPLVLDITINLGTEQIINHIRINPYYFGSKTRLEIIDIQTSSEGKVYESIKEYLLAEDLLAENDTLVIAPSTSKYSGQGLYSFFPRQAKFVRVALRQTTPYVIYNSKGKKRYRYAIGLRDIVLEKRAYKDRGEVISKSIDITTEEDPIRKVVLDTTEFNSGTLGNILHYVSVDDGTTWNPIRSLRSQGLSGITQEIPEVINYNGVDENSVETDSTLSSIRYKTQLIRNNDGFTNSLAKTTANKTELHQLPTSSPFIITLDDTPIEGSVRLLETFLGSRNIKDRKYSISSGIGDESIVNLPWTNIPRKISKSYSGGWNISYDTAARVFVDGVEWSEGLISAASGTDKYFQLDHNEGTIQFGDGTNGKAPKASSTVEVMLDEERLFPSVETGHIAQFEFPIADNKEELEIDVVYPIKITTEHLTKGNKIHKLKHKYLEEDLNSATISGNNHVTPVPYEDGVSEVNFSTYYSIDYESGILYTGTETSTSSDTTITYKYYPREPLTDYEFLTNSKISIKDKGWITHKPTYPLSVPTGNKYFNLEHQCIVEGSVVFNGGSSIFSKEVPFVDGYTEFLGVIKTREKLPAISSTGTVTINLSLPISSDTSLDVKFSNTDVFNSEKSSFGDISTDGDYYIHRDNTNPRVSVRVDSAVSDTGYITYYYINNNSSPSGWYSINYRTGEVFTYSTITSGITVEYRYTDYRARYLISREVPKQNFTVEDNRLTIKDQEIIKKLKVQKTGNNTDYYRVSYKYIDELKDDADALKNFYTPTLLDYRLRILTEGRLTNE